MTRVWLDSYALFLYAVSDFISLSVEILESSDFVAKCLNYHQLKILVRLSYYANQSFMTYLIDFRNILAWLIFIDEDLLFKR